MIFGVGCGSKAHRLLILPPIERQVVLDLIKCLAETGHVAVPKNTETATAQAHPFAVDLYPLILQILHDCLGGCQGEKFARSCCH